MNGECRMKIQIFNRLIRHGESFRVPRSVQESIPVRKIYRDGIWLCGGRYSKMWRFQDVNYAVASEADQAEILMRYCSVINAWPDDAYTLKLIASMLTPFTFLGIKHVPTGTNPDKSPSTVIDTG